MGVPLVCEERADEPLAILITGARGFVGQSLMRELATRGMKFDSPSRATINFEDERQMKKAFRMRRYKTIFHLASPGVFADADDHSLIARELSQAKNAWSLLAEGGRFIYAGSMSEYGKSGRLSETEVCTPKTKYGQAKLMVTEWLTSQNSINGVASVGRIFGAYGRGESDKRLFPFLINSLVEGRSVALSDGSQVRDFVHVQDVAKVLVELSLIEQPPVIVNIGTGRGVVVRDIIERICSELHADRDNLNFGSRKRSKHDLPELIADTTLLKKSLGFIPPQRLLRVEEILSLFS